MIAQERLSLNRIISPKLNLEKFFQLATELQVNKVELRNDLPGTEILDGYSPDKVKALSGEYGIRIITINALQHFNVHELLPKLMAELQELTQLAATIDCEALVLCPHNDPNDTRSPEKCYSDTVEALRAFAPIFGESGITGYVEPLGFKESSLSSLLTAMNAIKESGHSCYKIVHDTFHHHIGPDSTEVLGKGYDVSYTGLIHVSGVESVIPVEQYRDAHRVLISSADFLKSREQIEKLISLGYEGNISFEPFAEDIQQLPLENMKRAIHDSIEYLRRA